MAAIGIDKGVDHFAIYERSVKNEDFRNFLIELRSKFPNDLIALFMDNMRVHYSKISQETYGPRNHTYFQRGIQSII